MVITIYIKLEHFVRLISRLKRVFYKLERYNTQRNENQPGDQYRKLGFNDAQRNEETAQNSEGKLEERIR